MYGLQVSITTNTHECSNFNRKKEIYYRQSSQNVPLTQYKWIGGTKKPPD